MLVDCSEAERILFARTLGYRACMRGHESCRYGVHRRGILRCFYSGCGDLLEAAKLGQHESKAVKQLWCVMLKCQRNILCYSALSFGGWVSVQFAAEWGVILRTWLEHYTGPNA